MFFRKLESNALKSHDSQVNKRVKSSAERVSKACRTRAEYAERVLNDAERALNDAERRCNAPRSADARGNPNASRRPHRGDRIRRQSLSTDRRFRLPADGCNDGAGLTGRHLL